MSPVNGLGPQCERCPKVGRTPARPATHGPLCTDCKRLLGEGGTRLWLIEHGHDPDRPDTPLVVLDHRSHEFGVQLSRWLREAA